MISDFLGRFSKDIIIHLSPYLVSFYRENKTVQAKPILYLSNNSKSRKVLGWGDGFNPIEPHIKIIVFNFEDTLSKTSEDPYNYLTAFFRQGIAKTVDSISFVKPKITIQNIESLEDTMPENKKSIIEKALYDSGARECIFQ